MDSDTGTYFSGQGDSVELDLNIEFGNEAYIMVEDQKASSNQKENLLTS